ncbi:helix-turn-helix domain-containing protein [Palleronia sp.]|uniref:helix-turn-helix domain-containing protein n=1 Tax=Palleronia sp. TaxID=1940284 RepID=UPI0035C7915B
MGAPRLLTPQEAAETLRVCTKTLQRLRSDGLRYVKLGGKILYRPDDLDDYIEKRTIEECRSERKGRGSGTTTSRSGVVDFTALVGRTTSKKRKQ